MTSTLSPPIDFIEGKIVEGPEIEDGTFVPAPPAVRLARDVFCRSQTRQQSCEFTGVRYALQLDLNDPATLKMERTLTVYYDIPSRQIIPRIGVRKGAEFGEML